MRRPKNVPYEYVRPDGTIEVRWTNPQTGKRVTRIARDKHHAKRLRSAITIPAPPPPPPPPPTLGRWVATWLDMRVADGLDPSTKETYERALRRIVLPLRNHPVTEISPALLADCWLRLSRDPTPTGRAGYSVGSIRLTRHMLRLCLQGAVELAILPENPVRGRIGRSPQRRLDVSADRAAAILQAVRGTPAEGPCTLGLCYGMRLGEQLGLRWTDIDFAAGTLTVQGQRTVHGYKEKTKAGHRIELPLIAPVTEMLEREPRGASPFVFLGRGGKLRSRSGVRYAFDQALLRAGLPHIRLHDLRHMTATLLARLGVDIAVRQAIVGHASVQMHGLYRHISDEDKKSALEALSRALDSGSIVGGLKATP